MAGSSLFARGMKAPFLLEKVFMISSRMLENPFRQICFIVKENILTKIKIREAYVFILFNHNKDTLMSFSAKRFIPN